MRLQLTVFLFIVMHVCRLQSTKVELQSMDKESLRNIFLMKRAEPGGENFDKVIPVKSRFSFNIIHKELWDKHNTVYFYWMKNLTKGIYFEAIDVSNERDSAPNFYRLQRNESLKWKLRNITEAITEDKIERIRGGKRASLVDPVRTDDKSNPSFKIKILPRNNFRLVKTHPKNRNRIKIFEAKFWRTFPVIDFVYVNYVEDVLLFCALHNDVDSSLFVAYGRMRDSKVFSFTPSLQDILCINPHKNFPDTWISSSVTDSLVDVHLSASSRGVLFATQFLKKMSLQEARMLHVEHLKTAVSFDLGKSWSDLKLRNHCSSGDDEPYLYLDLSFSRLFFDKPFLGILETSKVPGWIISTGHLRYSNDTEMYPGVFVSEDGGLSWLKVFDERYLISMSSTGQLLTGIRQCLSGPTKNLFTSYDLGRRWKPHQIFDEDVCVHEVMTSPFNIFIILSSRPEEEMWIVSVIDFEKSALAARKCLRKDVQFKPLGTNGQFCVHGHRLLKYRRNSNVQCKILNYESKFMNLSCSCTEKDFFCGNDSCKNMTTEDLRTNFVNAGNYQELQSIALRLGFQKEVSNSCYPSRKGFDDPKSQLPKCAAEKKSLSNIRGMPSRVAIVLGDGLKCFLSISLVYIMGNFLNVVYGA